MDSNRNPRSRLLCALFALTAVAVCPGGAAAGVNRWTSLGPRSEATVTALAADASSPGVFYAATQGGGVFRSEDGGETWRASNTGLDDGNVAALAVDPSAAGTVYAATAAGLYKTTDGGATWYPASNGLSASVSSLAVDPVHPARLYAGGSSGVFRTTDGAGHWSPVLAGSGVAALAKGRNSTVYALIYIPEGGLRLYRSDDGGDHWNLVSTASFYPIALCVDPFDSATLYAVNNGSVEKSTDSGATWKRSGTGLVNARTIALSPADSKTIVAGTWDGKAFASSDAGATWQQLAGVPLATDDIRVLLVAPGMQPTVLAARGPSLLKGTTGANDPWHLVSQGLEAASVSAVAVSPLNASALLSTDGFGPLRSEDGGQSWSRPDPAGATVFYSLARSPSASFDLAGTDVGVLRSEDGGASWQATTLDGVLHTYINAFGFQPGSPQTVYSAAYDGIRKSTDSGKTWTLTKGGQAPAYAVLADRVGSGVLYATYGLTLSSGFYSYGFDELTVEKSTDDGRNWNKSDTGLPQDKYLEGPGVSALAMDPSNSLTLYAGTQNNGVFKSTDGAATWAPANQGIETLSVYSILADPSHPATLYLASTSGIYRSDDGALSWFPFNDGLENLAVSSLSIDATGQHLFASTGGGGIYEREIQAPSSCQDDENHACYLGRFLVSASAGPPVGNLAPLPVPVRQGERFGSFRLATDDTRPSDIFLKIVDGRALPGHAFWIFHAGLTHDSYALTVTDTSSGLSRVYANGPNRLGCGGIDTYAFPDAGAEGASGNRGSALSPGSGDTLVLAGGRFSVVLSATDPRTQRTAKGLAMPQDDRDGYFSLPDFTADPAFPEVFVRVSEQLDGSLTFDHTGLTDLAYEMTVTDSATGAVTALRNQTTDGLHPCGGSVGLGQ